MGPKGFDINNDKKIASKRCIVGFLKLSMQHSNAKNIMKKLMGASFLKAARVEVLA
jgi:hypothetical protein